MLVLKEFDGLCHDHLCLHNHRYLLIADIMIALNKEKRDNKYLFIINNYLFLPRSYVNNIQHCH